MANTSIPEDKAPILKRIYEETTFYRVHLAGFTFIPLIFSAIFYASNGRYKVEFIDSMFLCYSAMTVTGLATVNLSTMTVWQQIILYILMAIGNFTIVSWIVVLMRRRFLRTHCEYIVMQARSKPVLSKSSYMKTISSPVSVFKQQEPFLQESNVCLSASRSTTQLHVEAPASTKSRPTTPEVDEERDTLMKGKAVQAELPIVTETMALSSSPTSGNMSLSEQESSDMDNARKESPDITFSPQGNPSEEAKNSEYIRSSTVEFAPSPTNVGPSSRTTAVLRNRQDRETLLLRRTPTRISMHSLPPPGSHPSNRPQTMKYDGMGGFPGPIRLFQYLLRLTAPNMQKKIGKLERKLTMMPSIQTIESRNVPWLKRLDKLVVWRNSDFRTETLSDEQLEELAGAEYKALTLLTYLVPLYFVFWQIFCIVLFLPWLTVTKQYDQVFAAQPRLVGKPWFSFFQVMAAYTGGGLSLVDQGMLPFQSAYLMILSLGLAILAGNHAMPIFLRFIIWIASKILPSNSEKQIALSFLLDHPRRCFLYMFPSHQTWFLLICLVIFSVIEWVGFFVLNIGLPAYERIPIAARVVDALFQGLAARASGFPIVPLANLAPSLQFLYAVMMYIAIYPVALSIRSTNVYEERSLGIFEAPPDDEDEEPSDLTRIRSRKERLGKYVMWHLRRQTSIDIWWLVWGVFLVSIIERQNLLDESEKWFDLFRVIFELVSAFGGIGLSLGFPNDNYSFSGALRPLSKLVIIVIMVRGRHRGLPVAVDRAVLLPSELVTNTPHPAA